MNNNKATLFLILSQTSLLFINKHIDHKRSGYWGQKLYSWLIWITVTLETYLEFPAQGPICRLVGCDRVQSTAQDRGWAPLSMSYSSIVSGFHFSHNPSLQTAPHSSQMFHLLPSPLVRTPPPSLASFSQPPLPPGSSFCVVSKPCSLSRSPFYPGNAAQLGVLAHC